MDEMKLTDDDDGDTLEEEEVEPKLSDDDDGDTVEEEVEPKLTEDDISKLCAKSIGTDQVTKDNVRDDWDSKFNDPSDLPEDTVELSKEERESKDKINVKIMKLIMYRSQRKWYATISIIGIFGGLLGLMLVFIAMGKDMTPEWKEILLVLLGAFVGSFSRVIDHWFNNSQAEEKLLESAND